MSVQKVAVKLSSLTGRQHWLADRRVRGMHRSSERPQLFNYRADRGQTGHNPTKDDLQNVFALSRAADGLGHKHRPPVASVLAFEGLQCRGTVESFRAKCFDGNLIARQQIDSAKDNRPLAGPQSLRQFVAAGDNASFGDPEIRDRMRAACHVIQSSTP